MNQVITTPIKLSVFVPVYNEEEIIEESISLLEDSLKKLQLSYEIFIVNDASTDKTADIASSICASNSNIKILNYTNGPSRRENLGKSFVEARGEYLLYCDVDFSLSFSIINKMIHQINSGYDVVTGSRYANGANIKRKIFRYIISLMFNGFLRILFRTKIHDHMYGMKMARSNVIKQVVKDMAYDTTSHRGVFWEAELLIRASRRKYKISEIPVDYIDRRVSRLYFRREVRAVLYIFRFWLHLFESEKKCQTSAQSKSRTLST